MNKQEYNILLVETTSALFSETKKAKIKEKDLDDNLAMAKLLLTKIGIAEPKI